MDPFKLGNSFRLLDFLGCGNSVDMPICHCMLLCEGLGDQVKATQCNQHDQNKTKHKKNFCLLDI